MNSRIIFLISVLMFSMGSAQLFAKVSEPNVIYLSMDGLSPGPLFKVMGQRKIPHFNKMARVGSKSILRGVLDKPTLKDSLAVLWTGYPIQVGMSRHDSAFVFNRLKTQVPALKSTVIISHPKRVLPKEKAWGTIIKRDLIGIDKVYEEKERTSDEITQALVETITQSNGPFIIFANYPLCAQMALNYREGCGRYTEAILYLNKQLGVIQQALESKGVAENTVFILTASYSFIEGTQFPSSKSWVISSKKLKPGKSALDLVPTIYDLYSVSYEGFEPKFSGKSLL